MLLTALSLTLAGCSSWDTGTTAEENQSQRAIIDQLNSAGRSVDPRTLRGVSTVDSVAEVQPVTDHAQPSLPVELTDDDGHRVTVRDASRILALDLYGTYTKILRGLGLSGNIVGRTNSSTEASLASLPVVTQGGHELNVEAILSLRPTLVIVDHSIGPASAIDQIRAAGVTTVVMPPDRSLDKMQEGITNLANVVGLPKEGEQLAQRSQKEYKEAVDTIAKIAPDKPLRMAFLYTRGQGGVFYILGKESATDDLIGGLGGEDIATQQGIGAPSPANAEALAKLNPEVFVMMNLGLESTGNLSGLLARPGVAQTIAGKNQRIISLPDGDSLAFGPQTGQMLLQAAQALYLQEGKVQ